jgi:cytochrome c-type biogenesis protein CcmH/NrfG
MASGRGAVPAEEAMVQVSSPRRRRARPRVQSVLAGALAGLALAVASPREVRAEEPWERPVREAVADQDRELARTSPKALVNRYSGRLVREPNDLPTLYLLARAYGKAKDPQNAIVTYGDVLKLEPRLWYAWRDRAALRWEQKDAAGAEADLRQAIALKPDFATALQDLATILLAQPGAKGAEEATRLLDRVLNLEPGNEKARFQLVSAYLVLNRPDDGLRELQPMLSREPNHPGLRLKRAELLGAKGRFEEAFEEFKRLAAEKPGAQEPLRGWLATAKQAKTFQADEALWVDALWVLERLARLVSEAERKDILTEVARIRKRQAEPRPEAPAGPPKPEQLAAALRSGDARVRRDVLVWLLSRDVGYEFEAPLKAALVERALRPGDEPEPANRSLALGVLGRTAQPGIAPIVRLALYDPDAVVRAKAADVLGELGAPASLAVLYDSAVGDPAIPDAALREMVAIAAQTAVYRIAQVPAPPSEETFAARVEAFRAWWKSPAARPKKLAAIEDVLKVEENEIAEKAPWYVFRPFLEDEDPYVWTRTYYAFKNVASRATGESPLAAWLRALPAHDEKTLVPENRAAYLREMLAWWARKPA